MSQARTSELEGLNRVLRAVKEAPAKTLNASFGVDGQAKEALDDAARDVLCERWTFNTDVITVRTDQNNELRLPDSALSAEVVVPEGVYGRQLDRYILRGTKIWDRMGETYQFAEGTNLRVRVTKWLPWNERPEHANRLIIAIAARDLNREAVGDSQADTILERRVDNARARFESIEAASNKSNAFDVDDLANGDPRWALSGYY